MLISVLYLTVSRTFNRTVNPHGYESGGKEGGGGETDLKLYYSAVQIVNRYATPNCEPEKKAKNSERLLLLLS